MNTMSDSANNMVCISVKSRSVFPELLPFEPSQRRVRLGIVQFGASSEELVSSLPLFELCVVIMMFILASH